MFIQIRSLSVGFLMLTLQMGLAHAVQHDLHDFNPTALTLEHEEGDCLLADTPQAKSIVPTIDYSFASLLRHDVLPTLSRHDTTTPSKAKPRAPPVSL